MLSIVYDYCEQTWIHMKKDDLAEYSVLFYACQLGSVALHCFFFSIVNIDFWIQIRSILIQILNCSTEDLRLECIRRIQYLFQLRILIRSLTLILNKK